MELDSAQFMNSGENGEARMVGDAYPRIAVRAIRLSPAGRTRDEMMADGCDSAAGDRSGAYPDSIPGFPGAYP